MQELLSASYEANSEDSIGGSTNRKCDISKTTYQRLMESNQISDEAKAELEALYLGLDPAQLKRDIESERGQPYQTHEGKRRTREVDLIESWHLLRLHFTDATA